MNQLSGLKGLKFILVQFSFSFFKVLRSLLGILNITGRKISMFMNQLSGLKGLKFILVQFSFSFFKFRAYIMVVVLWAISIIADNGLNDVTGSSSRCDSCLKAIMTSLIIAASRFLNSRKYCFQRQTSNLFSSYRAATIDCLAFVGSEVAKSVVSSNEITFITIPARCA